MLTKGVHKDNLPKYCKKFTCHFGTNFATRDANQVIEIEILDEKSDDEESNLQSTAGAKNLLCTVSPSLYVNVYTNMSRKIHSLH